MGVKLGFHEATLHASFTPKATPAAERLSRSEASCLNYAKSCARAGRAFMKQCFMPVLRQRLRLWQ